MVLLAATHIAMDIERALVHEDSSVDEVNSDSLIGKEAGDCRFTFFWFQFHTVICLDQLRGLSLIYER